jgi:hypothetical protein
MKILSLDIGINNLSYCILSWEEGKYIIHHWGILNVNPYEEINNDIAKQNKDIDKSNKKLLKNDLKNKCEEDEKSENIDIYVQPKLTKKKVKKKPSVNQVAHEIITLFDNTKHLLDCRYVLIENQPCMKNPTMKSIQMIVYSYFYIRGITDAPEDKKLKDIVFLSASNKLKVYDGPKLTFDVKSKYTLSKKLGIEHTKYFLKDNEEKLSFFNSHKKKDDLADAFLQGVYFINKRLKLS